MSKTKRVSYNTFRANQQKEYDDFAERNMFFAFSHQQLEEGMQKLGLDANKPEDMEKITKSYAGGIILKEKAEELRALLDRNAESLHDYILENEENAYDAMLCELENHEYCITMDPLDALYALGLSFDEVAENEMLSKAFQKACRAATHD